MDVVGGNIGSTDKKISQGGKEYLQISIAETEGFGKNRSTTWYRCNVFGSKYSFLEKGMKVIVYGDIETSEYNGKTYRQIHPFFIMPIELSEDQKDVLNDTAPKYDVKTDEDIPF